MRRYFSFLWSLRRFFDAFNDEWDRTGGANAGRSSDRREGVLPVNTTPECALALWRYLTVEKYQDHQRTTAYYEDIVRFVRDWKHPLVGE